MHSSTLVEALIQTARRQIADSQIKIFAMAVLLASADDPWSGGDPSWVKRGPDGRFGGGGSSSTVSDDGHAESIEEVGLGGALVTTTNVKVVSKLASDTFKGMSQEQKDKSAELAKVATGKDAKEFASIVEDAISSLGDAAKKAYDDVKAFADSLFGEGTADSVEKGVKDLADKVDTVIKTAKEEPEAVAAGAIGASAFVLGGMTLAAKAIVEFVIPRAGEADREKDPLYDRNSDPLVDFNTAVQTDLMIQGGQELLNRSLAKLSHRAEIVKMEKWLRAKQEKQVKKDANYSVAVNNVMYKVIPTAIGKFTKELTGTDWTGGTGGWSDPKAPGFARWGKS